MVLGSRRVYSALKSGYPYLHVFAIEEKTLYDLYELQAKRMGAEVYILTQDGRLISSTSEDAVASGCVPEGIAAALAEHPGENGTLRIGESTYDVICLDDAMGEERVFFRNTVFRLEVPFEEAHISYSPRAFAGEMHYLTARPATADEISAPRNLARNRYDHHENTGIFPHAWANVETRGESVFAAWNAIDGIVFPTCHGRYPFESWGINRDPNACWTLDFGRLIQADTLVLTTRADFPHDAWWTQARLTLSSGEEQILPLQKTAEGQRFDLHGVWITGLKLDQLIKADDPSPFPALTQVEVYGRNPD